MGWGKCKVVMLWAITSGFNVVLTDLPKFRGPLPHGSARPALEFFFFSGLDPIVFPEGKPTRFFSKESNYVIDMKPGTTIVLSGHFRSFFLPYNGLKRPEKKDSPLN